jgi:hypothetical protein
MKHTSFLTTLVIILFSTPIFAQEAQIDETMIGEERVNTISNKKLNFFIISKRKKGKLDPATRFNVMRTKIRSLLRPKKFVAIIAADADQGSAKIIHRLKKHKASIGTIWFDSHGSYKKGYSLFFVGHDEVSFSNINDSTIADAFNNLASYTSDATKLVIGSCYGGATYQRSSIDYRDTTRMNGDSLMMALGSFFPNAKIYGSESWVMTKPGIFNAKKPAVAGFPKRKLYRDVCYRPAWENIGKWNEYNAATKTFTHVNTVALDSYGNLSVVRRSFNERPATKKDILKNTSRLEFDLFK